MNDARTWAPRRILVIRMGHIGDVVLVTPALALLNQLFPEAEISLLVRAGTEPVLENHPLVKRLYAGGDITSNPLMHQRTKASFWRRFKQLPRDLGLVGKLKSRRFDLAVDFSGGDRSALYAWLSGARDRVGWTRANKGRFRKRAYNWGFPDTTGLRHKVLKDFELLRNYHSARSPGEPFPPQPGPLLLNPLPSDLAWAREQWSQTAACRMPGILIHPTSRVLYKCWSPRKWAEVADRLQAELNCAVLLTCGPDSRELAFVQRIVQACRRPVPCLFGGLRLGQLAALIQNAHLFLGADSAPMHIAAAVGTRVVAVFGPSHEEVWGPWGDGHVVVRRPCGCLSSGKRRCNENRGMGCLDSISVEEVLCGVKKALKPFSEP